MGGQIKLQVEMLGRIYTNIRFKMRENNFYEIKFRILRLK